MIDKGHPGLSIAKQCDLLSISRSSFYYTRKGETALNLMLMRLIDEQFLETPFYGVRQMKWHLRAQGHLVNEKRIRRLMRLMGLMPIYQAPKTSTKAKGHKIWPYLLRGMRINRANQVWCSDVTPDRGPGQALHSDAPWLPVSRCHYGLDNTQGSGLAVVQHAGGRVLCRGSE